jgi:hypothetical protein
MNKALATACTEEEIEAIMETPLAVLLAPQSKMTPSGARRGSADQWRQPPNPTFYAALHQIIKHAEG